MQASFPAVVISGTGLYRPPHVISNAELVAAFNAYADLQNAEHAAAIAAGERQPLTHSSVEFIEKASGIKQRYVVEKSGVLDPARMYPRFEPRPDDQLSLMAEIAVDAAQKALAAAGKTGADVDAVLCSSANMQRAYPAMAVEIQQALGAGGYGFDMNVACSSATFALEQAVNAVRTGSARCVLVVNPEITSAHLEWRDRDCHFIFGDVCTALVVERADTATSADQWEVLGTRLVTQFSSNIRNNFGFMNRAEDRDPSARDLTFYQEGRKVFKEVVPMAAAHIEGHLAELGLEPTQLRRFWLHQANQGMNQFVIRKLVGGEAGSEVAPLILDEYANTASAGSIIAFHHHRADLKAGDTGVICSFGAGYSIGSVVVRKR
ncbi:beta-ketoacyl-ACP synthase III [Pelomonas aquatica]|jgi:beta-ketodecanoyl-[acyl-carrier-protein] synthase|uniref:Beta-ketoacyl-ACP synthase III n=1 Tax=Pelomonas aquatica TaxID=431058 RepID=A0A9X4LDQ4_9BURK|nr:beta-ketoacyl-ACP synthase III [Pelomonas aquatica]MCY4755111.1 beta-ketoacyl-ACP synthase III [Pelomonas aquatica]MDG0860874.1 beta-ketoacyl-ACP synthase III [Pelomonas aquatica]